MITESLRCAVIGHPAGHSLSPVLHRAAFAELGLDWSYQALDLAPEALTSFVEQLDESWRGLSVTMPHKQAIRAFGEGDELVDLVGAANTLVLPGPGRLPGAEHIDHPLVRNTDVGGYQLAFASIGVESADSAMVIGNGATARSAAVALRMMGVERLVVLARTPERAQDLRAFCVGALGMLCQVRPLAIGESIASDIVISTVPQGGADVLAEELVAACEVVVDSVYDPWPTALASAGQAAGRPTLSGLDLLAGQAVEQVRLFTGGEVAFEMLRRQLP